jgi:hypothetical protein
MLSRRKRWGEAAVAALVILPDQEGCEATTIWTSAVQI